LRFPDWMYGGPYVCVSDPDRDLPRRDPRVPLTMAHVLHTEQDGVVKGERFVAPFRDANSLDEILGCLLFAQEYPGAWDNDERYRYPTIQGLLTEAILRIETKISRTSIESKSNWFREALDRVVRARTSYSEGHYSVGEELLAEAAELLQSGNKAHRRKVDAHLGPGGSPSV
jgi:hypothetical protein